MATIRATATVQPKEVCWDCGKKYGCRMRDGVSSYHIGRCDVCGKAKTVTEPRDFGYLNKDWLKHERT